jgi:hypothetical protein
MYRKKIILEMEGSKGGYMSRLKFLLVNIFIFIGLFAYGGMLTTRYDCECLVYFKMAR